VPSTRRVCVQVVTALLNIPTGQPLVYELDNDLKPLKHYYIGNEDAINASIRAVANQGTSKR